MNFYKKILLTLLVCICFFFSQEVSYSVTKINDVSFDNSNSFLFLSATNSSQPQQINSTILKSPDRVFFDITDAIMTSPPVSLDVSNSQVKQVKVSQFSINPNVVRVVFYLDAKYNPKNISIIDVNGNYLFRTNPMKIKQQNIATVFTDEKELIKNKLETVTYKDTPEVDKPSVTPNSTAVNSFSELSKVAANQSLNKSLQNQQVADNELKLRTQFYMSRVDVKRGHILISGLGSISMQNPIYLTNPNRVVFDLPNTVVSPKFKNVEIHLGENETIKIGQFEPAKVRVVITAENPAVFRPIFSQDSQSVLISNDLRMSGITLFEKSIDVASYSVTAQSPTEQTLKLTFSAPVIHSIKKDANKTEIVLYNVLNPNFVSYSNAIRSTFFQATKNVRQQSIGIKYIIPTKNMTVDYQLSKNAKELHIKLTKHSLPEIKPVVIPEKRQNVCYSGKELIIIDPGHGGADTGALKAGINEKDINLEISKTLAQILTQKGYKVEMTRWDDKTVSLAERVNFSDCRNSAIFVSIHSNSSVKGDAQGIETHYWTSDGYELAKPVHACLSKHICAVDRGLFKSRFYVINHTKAKSILVEVGFMSNDKERNQLLSKDRQRKTAEGIAEGIDEFIRMESKGKK